MKIIKNFLDYSYFKNLQDIATNLHFKTPYFLGNPTQYDNKDTYYFVHILYEEAAARSENFNLIIPLLKKLDVKSLVRAKINLYPKTEKLESHGSHADFPFEHKGCILSLNNCDGFTQIGDQNIPSIENQVLLFDPHKKHNSTSTTNAPFRININLNYF